jgi:hypothetical protein
MEMAADVAVTFTTRREIVLFNWTIFGVHATG